MFNEKARLILAFIKGVFKMKKLLSIMLVLALCLGCMFAVTGCSEKKAAAQYKIGIIQLVEHVALDAATEGFKQAIIDELGADAVEFDVQNGQGDPATCSTIANQFVSNKVNLIMANATPALQAAAAATADIPILGTSVTEYGVALDLKDFSGTVGGNISGTSDLAPLDKQAPMITEWCPNAKNVALLYCSKEANSQYQVDVVKKELENKGLKATLYPFADSNDLAQVCTNAADNNDVIYVPTDNTVAENTGIIDNICAPKKIPVIAGEEGICSGCGIATLSISYYDLGYTTGKMAVKILKDGADISTMPIEYAEKQTPKYNEQICNNLGITPLEGYAAIEAK
jgi:putative ABC transport system substrate-binding protein